MLADGLRSPGPLNVHFTDICHGVPAESERQVLADCLKWLQGTQALVGEALAAVADIKARDAQGVPMPEWTAVVQGLVGQFKGMEQVSTAYSVDKGAADGGSCMQGRRDLKSDGQESAWHDGLQAAWTAAVVGCLRW